MSGRGLGFCAGFNAPGFMNAVHGRRGIGYVRGCGRGFGMGMGWRNGWSFQYAPVSHSQIDELTNLRNQAKYLDQALQSINKRISELETESK
jgi:hypothetical protein